MDTPAATVTKGGAMLVRYAPPMLGIGLGYVMSDVFGLHQYIYSWINPNIPNHTTSVRLTLIFTAAIYALISYMIWKKIDHIVGNFIAGFLAGIAIRALIEAI